MQRERGRERERERERRERPSEIECIVAYTYAQHVSDMVVSQTRQVRSTLHLSKIAAQARRAIWLKSLSRGRHFFKIVFPSSFPLSLLEMSETHKEITNRNEYLPKIAAQTRRLMCPKSWYQVFRIQYWSDMIQHWSDMI